MKNTPLLIDLKPSKSAVYSWSADVGFFGRIDNWLVEHKKTTFPIMGFVLFSAFGAALNPWFKHYQTFKEVESVSSALTSFQSLYRSYGDGSLQRSSIQFASPVDELIESIEAKMVMLDIDKSKLQQAKAIWRDGYYLTGSSKEVLIKTVSASACSKISQTPLKAQSLIQSLTGSYASGRFYAVNCYLQPWKETPDPQFSSNSFVDNGLWVTPVAYIVIKDPEKSKRRDKKSTIKMSSI